VAGEICAGSELTNTTVAIQRLDSDELAKFNLGGQAGVTNIINESGLYSLVLISRKMATDQLDDDEKDAVNITGAIGSQKVGRR